MSRVQSIERAFAVLGALADGPIGVTEVADRADLPKSTAARLLASLAREGVVEQVPGDTRYRLGPRLVTLAARIRPGRSLAALARPSLEALADTVGEAAGLSIADGDLVHYIEQVSSPNPVSVRDWTGSRIPLHAVSSGQVLLAYAPTTFVQRYLGRPMERFTPRTLVTADELLERMRAIRRDGYTWALEEFDEGISSVAAPVADASGEVVAAVHLHGPSYRFPVAGRGRRAGRPGGRDGGADLGQPAPGGLSGRLLVRARCGQPMLADRARWRRSGVKAADSATSATPSATRSPRLKPKSPVRSRAIPNASGATADRR